ncbi:MAG: hypothetical protein ABL861_03370 [Nitrosomonas sp.]
MRGLHFGEVKIETDGEQHVVEVQVELYADKVDDGIPVRQEMKRVHAYRALVMDARPLTDYTARIVPYHEGAAIL